MAPDSPGCGIRRLPGKAQKLEPVSVKDEQVKQLTSALKKALQDLASVGAECALVGGLAVGVRSEPRFTRDVDLAVSVFSDEQAEQIVRALFAKGYSLEFLLEHKRVKRIGTARLITPYHDEVFLDLLFAACGVETEIVEGAELVTVVRGVRAKVARRGHLIAMKLLSVKSDRPQDKIDLHELSKVATRRDWDDASQALVLIKKRGFARGRNLSAKLSALRGESFR